MPTILKWETKGGDKEMGTFTYSRDLYIVWMFARSHQHCETFFSQKSIRRNIWQSMNTQHWGQKSPLCTLNLAPLFLNIQTVNDPPRPPQLEKVIQSPLAYGGGAGWVWAVRSPWSPKSLGRALSQLRTYFLVYRNTSVWVHSCYLLSGEASWKYLIQYA